MGERIKLTAADGFTFNAYRAAPTGVAKGAVVLIQEVWGLNHFIRSDVDRYAAAGYLTIAPALFDRVELGYESEDYSPTGFAKIGELMKNFDRALVLRDVEPAITAVAHAGKVGITGYCFGGATTWRAAHAGLGLSAASGYYGGGVPSYIDLKPQIPLEMHYGDKDTGIPLEQIEDLRKAHPDVPVYLYPAQHGFCNFDRPSNYDAPSTRLAHERTLAFFAKHLA
ncbi:MAG TPA: dienelactone hydrolase family protein [Devosia sp.]|nr:dienelactone hydrolase family protein [Devosia sp.]